MSSSSSPTAVGSSRGSSGMSGGSSGTSRTRRSYTSKQSSSSISSSDSYGRTLYEAYNDWKTADDATTRLGLEERERSECEKQLKTAKKMAENLRATRNLKGGLAKRRPSLMTFLGKKNLSLPHLPLQTSSDDNADLVDATIEVQELERRLHQLTKQVEATKVAAAALDECYDILRHILESGPLPSWRFMNGNENAITRAEKTVAARDRAYIDDALTAEAFQRARQCIQSAHHHYSQAMDLVDSVCSPSRSTWAAAMGDEQSKEQTYKEAGNWAQKAQVCFNECMRVLEPHWDLLRRDEEEDCEQLKQAGLLQAVRLYELMYGGRALQFGITQQVTLMLTKQSAVFERLTHFAVGIQNCTENCQSITVSSRESRDNARRQAVSLWMNNGDFSVSTS